MDIVLTRKNALVKAGGFAAALLTAGRWRFGATDEASAAAVSCILTPELTEGPYYIAGEKLRRNITDGHPGTPLTLKLKVVDATTCRPIKNASVDIWHADAAGNYSGFSAGSASRTFMRGIQKTDANGIATFQTVYPGWYMGRTVHIHVKVHVGGNVVHTGQLFFNDGTTDLVYAKAPYRSRGNRDTRNVDDMIYGGGGSRSIVKIAKNSAAAGYVGTLTMGVRR
jgi:protocatechuate 3,4-dioxygenase beta subunit